MKRCPSCQRVYEDETVTFCFDDGATLMAVANAYPPPQFDTGPIPVPRETNPAATEIYTTPPAFPAAPHPSAPAGPPAKSRAGLVLGIVSLLLVALSLIMMTLGFVGVAAEWGNSAVGGLIVGTMFISLFGAAIGLVGVLRAVRNSAGKVVPLLGFLANGAYLLFIIGLLVLGVAAS